MTDDELKRLLEMNSVDIRTHFDVSTEEVKREIRTLAEGITRVDEKLDRTAADIREEMRRGFGETQAMIKFSHVELDRRIRTIEDSHRGLEETVSDLQTRVERLESSAH